MEQMKKLLAHLSMAQKLSIAAAAVLVAAALFGFAQWRRAEDFRPLYTGLAPEDAGAVVQKLKEAATEYQLPGTGATFLAPWAGVADRRLHPAGGKSTVEPFSD